MSTTLLRSRTGTVERWVLNSPATRNALDAASVEALLHACAEVSEMSNTLLRVRAGTTERWVLNSPATRNALDAASVEALLHACAEASLDNELRFVVQQRVDAGGVERVARGWAVQHPTLDGASA